MAEFFTNWTPEEFKAYVLLYCSNADFVTTAREKKFIRSKIDKTSYRPLLKEFNDDSESLRIQKIRATTEIYRGSGQDTRSLISDIMALFISDGSYDTLEKELLKKVKALLR